MRTGSAPSDGGRALLEPQRYAVGCLAARARALLPAQSSAGSPAVCQTFVRCLLRPGESRPFRWTKKGGCKSGFRIGRCKRPHDAAVANTMRRGGGRTGGVPSDSFRRSVAGCCCEGRVVRCLSCFSGSQPSTRTSYSSLNRGSASTSADAASETIMAEML